MSVDEGITIASFAPGDEAAVADLILAIQQAEFGVAITLADQPDLMQIPAFYQQGAGGFRVARAGARIVGTIALQDIGGGDGALRKMFVAADYRGAAFGVGGRLLEGLLADAGRGGLKRVYLGTTEAFKAAHRFYEKNGFALVDRGALPPAFPVMAVDTRFYVRSLVAAAT